MNVLLLTKYGPKAASCRYRILQFLPTLEQHGITCTLSPLFDDIYLEHKYRTGSARLRDVVRAFLRRMRAILSAKRYDLVVLTYEAFPYLPPFLEHYLRSKNIPILYDYDDAIFHNYDKHPNPIIRQLFGRKIAKVIADAAFVFAGNEYLADYAKAVNGHVEVLPTVVDTDRYKVSGTRRPEKDTFVIGWIGSPTTSVYLQEVATPLQAFCQRHPETRIVLVGSGPVELPELPLEIKDWAEATEIRDIQSFDVGIMPLTDTPWARGKCGFKLIQYMACGVPVVASPVGVNCEIIDHGVNGYLSRTSEDWLEGLTRLLSDPEGRKQMGRAARRKVESHYSLSIAAPRMAKRIAALAGKNPL